MEYSSYILHTNYNTVDRTLTYNSFPAKTEQTHRTGCSGWWRNKLARTPWPSTSTSDNGQKCHFFTSDTKNVSSISADERGIFQFWQTTNRTEVS